MLMRLVLVPTAEAEAEPEGLGEEEEEEEEEDKEDTKSPSWSSSTYLRHIAATLSIQVTEQAVHSALSMVEAR